jgi:acetyl esterase/lipase
MKLLSIVPALFATLHLTAHADDIRRIALDGSPAPAPAEEVGKDGLARIKQLAQPALEVFPSAKQPSQGTIMVSPGGGYGGLAVTHEGRDVAKMLNEAGWDAAVLLYHINAGDNTRALALDDARTALALLQKRGAEFGLSTKRIGAMGFSAGGHLTARLAHETASATPPQFLVLMYPAYLEKDGKALAEVTPLKAPTFLYVAGNDKYAPSAVAYAAACEAAHVRHELHKPELGGHGFGLKKDRLPAVQDWPEKLRAFLGSL